jgi:6,7-dimethyl-8-ribityllumazine synthase
VSDDRGDTGGNAGATGVRLALGNGILTVEDKDQAMERHNSGGQAALACLRMIEIKKDLGLLPK